MGILADAFLLVVDPILTITVDPLRRQYRTLKNKWGGAIGAKDFSSVSSNAGDDTLVARNFVFFWLIYGHRKGTENVQFVGTRKMLEILKEQRDSAAYIKDKEPPSNDVVHFIQELEVFPSSPTPA